MIDNAAPLAKAKLNPKYFHLGINTVTSIIYLTLIINIVKLLKNN